MANFIPFSYARDPDIHAPLIATFLLMCLHGSEHPRFDLLDVIAVMQLHWAELDNYLLDLVKPYLSAAEFMSQYPAKSL